MSHASVPHVEERVLQKGNRPIKTRARTETVTHSRLCLGSRLVPYASVEGLADAKTHADGDGDDEDDD